MSATVHARRVGERDATSRCLPTRTERHVGKTLQKKRTVITASRLVPEIHSARARIVPRMGKPPVAQVRATDREREVRLLCR